MAPRRAARKTDLSMKMRNKTMTPLKISQCDNETIASESNYTHRVKHWKFNAKRWVNGENNSYALFIHALTVHLQDIISPTWALGKDGHRPFTSEEDLHEMDTRFEKHMNDGAIWVRFTTWDPVTLKEFVAKQPDIDLLEDGECECICMNLQRRFNPVNLSDCEHFQKTNRHHHIVCKFYEEVDDDNVEDRMRDVSFQRLRGWDFARSNEEKIKMWHDVNCRESKLGWNCRFWNTRNFKPFARIPYNWKTMYFSRSNLFNKES